MSTPIIIRDEATPNLRAMIRRARNAKSILKQLGNEGKVMLQDHFAARDGEPNKNEWKKTHFWGGIAKATKLGEVTDTRAQIVVSDYRFVHKVQGGPISGNGKALAIPMSYEASRAKLGREGKAAAFPGLFYLRGPKGAYLATQDKDTGRIKVHYLLRRSVNQRPDPRALPDQTQFAARITERAAALINRVEPSDPQ
jgi:rhodanese-related sulfurtransferase